MKVTRVLKQKWADLLLGEFTPHSIALGFSLGTIAALLPTFGFSILLALVLMFVFPHINRPAIFFALVVWNPVVQIPIYALSIHLGGELFGNMPVVKYNIEVLNQAYSFTKRFLVAHLIVTIVCTISVYVLSYATLKYLFLKKIVQPQQ